MTTVTLWAPLLASAIAMLVSRLCGRRALTGLLEWWPLILMIALYVQLDPYTRLLHPAPLDPLLARLDVRLFGVAPALWVERLGDPRATEIMAIGYSSYFVLPLLTAAPAYIPTEEIAGVPRMRNERWFREILTAQVLALGMGYLGYILVPAQGPRFFLASEYHTPLHGAIGYYDWAIAVWNRMQEVRCDAFPSLHTATGVLSLYFGFRFRALFPPLPYLSTPLSILLILSTIYLRMHYAVDVAAGVAVGLVAVLTARTLNQRIG